MVSIGQELKRERGLRGITLKEIAESTKINLRFLQALENDELDLIPGEFFIKGILRAYAKYIGLDEEYVLNKYYEDTLLKKQELEKEKEKRKGTPVIFQKKANFINIVFLSVFLLLIILSFYFISRPQKKPEPLPETKIPAPIQNEKPPPPSVSEPAINEVKDLNLEIFFLEETWIQAYADGELILDGIKNPGEEATIKASKELVLHLGNAGGISYILNGKKGKPLGESNVAIRNIKITFDNYDQFLLKEEDSKDG
ncbi:MAG: helix-turn-helix domain-containing protein [Candidatus Aminicenantaceae bacterium]